MEAGEFVIIIPTEGRELRLKDIQLLAYDNKVTGQVSSLISFFCFSSNLFDNLRFLH